MQTLRRPLTEAGIAYSISAAAPVFLSLALSFLLLFAMGEGYAESELYLYLAYLVPQLCLCGAEVLFFVRTKTPFKTFYRGCKWYYFPLAVLLSYGLFSLGWVNGVFIGLFEQFGYTPQDVPIPDLSGLRLLPAVLVIGVLPALFEETLFRGIGVGTMEKEGWGTAAIVFVSGGLFALFHGNPVQTVYQCICGCCYALLAVRSGSVLPGMLAHFTNNAAILALAAAGYGDALPAAAQLPVYLTAGAVLCGVLLFLALQKKRTARGMAGAGKYFLAAAVGIGICAVEWIVTLVGGFL